MDYYEQTRERYRAAAPELREASREHWIKCHAENLQAGRPDMIIFSGKILAGYFEIDADEARERMKAYEQI